MGSLRSVERRTDPDRSASASPARPLGAIRGQPTRQPTRRGTHAHTDTQSCRCSYRAWALAPPGAACACGTGRRAGAVSMKLRA